MEYSDSVKSISPDAINELATESDKYTVNPCRGYFNNSKKNIILNFLLMFLLIIDDSPL